MSIPKTSSAGEEQGRPRAQSVHKRTVRVAAMLGLAATFIFVGAPAAIAAPASTSNHTSYAAGGPNDDCTGNCSWPCSFPCGSCACSGGA